MSEDFDPSEDFARQRGFKAEWLENLQALLLSPVDYKKALEQSCQRERRFDGTSPGVMIATTDRAVGGFYFRGVPVIGKKPS